jgi:hypothetical protein
MIVIPHVAVQLCWTLHQARPDSCGHRQSL